MKKNMTRRNFIKASGAIVSSASLGSLLWPVKSFGLGGKPKPRVVIVGGGFGGVTCARYIKKFDTNIDVTLIERDTQFVTCPFSNLVLGGLRDMNSITYNYDAVKNKDGVNVIHDEVTDIDMEKRQIKTKGGQTFDYDRAVFSPGIDFLWDKVEGYSEADVETIPHAWKAGKQTTLLKSQLEAMEDGGTFVMVAPPNPFRCPPGPYERASMIAHYLKTNKPKSKVIILDAKENFSKQPLFTKGWEALYPGMIEWVAGTKGGIVTRADAKNMELHNEAGDTIKGAVINYIPHQAAGTIARKLGLADATGWCPVNQKTFESTLHKNIHVIGDSSVSDPLPKSGYAASSEGKMCAAAVVAAINGIEMPNPSYSNTCYSLVGPDYGISIAAVYRFDGAKIISVDGAGGVSPADADESFRRAEALYASGWYTSITQELFG
ncbi:MAG: NAD(P)/FAD-dependent oxidoreductase [Gammaproteobacteria bacterium]|nr:NAD(P)/FAD-dependent oxidoreductase [Gammaproteobacteria bacterium]